MHSAFIAYSFANSLSQRSCNEQVAGSCRLPSTLYPTQRPNPDIPLYIFVILYYQTHNSFLHTILYIYIYKKKKSNMGLKQRTFNFLNPHFETHETHLEKLNKRPQAQRLRRTQYRLFCTDWIERINLLDRLQMIFDCEHELRLIAQREAGFLEQARLLEEEIISEPSAPKDEEYGRRKIETLRTLIADLHTPEYETAAQALHSNDHLLPNGPVLRALQSNRQNPQTYLTQYHRQQCAQMQGCCARGCRCCEKPRNATRAMGSWGHCTGECACCRRVHGEGLSMASRDVFGEFDRENPDGEVFGRLMNLYVWGEV